jgi:hypothetical protein
MARSGGRPVGAELEGALLRVAPRVSEPEVIEQAVAKLQEIERRTGLERTLAIGALVLETFFGGDERLWRNRRRNKNNSIRRLAGHRDCPFCKSALNDAIGVYVAVNILPCVRTFGHITSSHVTAVLRLPASEREDVLRAAENERWSVRQLCEHVTEVRRVEGERRGRPIANEGARVASALRSAVKELESCTNRLQRLTALDPETRKELAVLYRQVTTVGVALKRRAEGYAPLASVRDLEGDLEGSERAGA